MSIGNGLPKSISKATETKDGLMSSRDKKILNKLVKQVAELFKTLSSISSDKITHSYDVIKVNDTECAKVELIGNVVTISINTITDNVDDVLFILPDGYIPSNPMIFNIPITVTGDVDYADIKISTDGTVMLDTMYEQHIMINTSVSFIK